MILLSSSSFFLPYYLTEKINSSNYSNGQFAFALKNNYISALIIQEQNSAIGSVNWLRLNRALAVTQHEAALKLARWYLIKNQKEGQANKQSVTQQAAKGVLSNAAIIWFEQAIRLHSQLAIIELAQLYFEHGQVVKAQSIINHFPEILPNNKLGETAWRLRLTIAIYLGEVDNVKQLLNSELLADHTNNKHSETNRLLADIAKYTIINKSPLIARNDTDKVNLTDQRSPSCLTSLQLFATNLSHLTQLEQLIKSFKAQQPLAHYICLPTPKYISIKQLDCSAKKHQAIFCDEARWQSVAKEVNSRHIGLMLNEGGANVHLGILYFDSQDGIDVFSHEVSHLLGFVDEYPLIKGHDKCQGIQVKPFSYNIAVLKKYYQGDKQKLRSMILKNIPWANSIKAETPILQLVHGRLNKQKIWRLGTPLNEQDNVGVYVSESCHNASKPSSSSQGASYSAFKPLNRRTQLRYFANDFPSEYLTLIEDKPSAYLMPSFHYNIALALYQQGKVTQAKYWLNKAGQWESNQVRKAMILKGGF